MDQNITRLTLIQKLQEDCDDKSWEEFIELYKGYVFVIIKSMNFSDSDCHDIMQATFLKVWENVQSFNHRGRNGQFRRWLSKISKNIALTHIQKNKSEEARHTKVYMDKQEDFLKAITEPEIDEIAEKEWASYISNVAWENIKENVNDQQKTILELSMQGKSRVDIAATLGLPLNTISVYKRRVISALQKEIKRLDNEFG
ncbi:MAG: sigma-70 family RNA polymerase sigma factor [Lentisphaeraceae bacterium]|nr:sigma-70 family RNA polymerase sigma factor [Lentisphaeraceae bacterium]